MVEKYWKARFNSIYMNFVEIEYNQLKKFGNKKVQYIIYANAYKIESHKCDTIKWIAKIGKIYTYVIPKYVNYRRNYQATTFKCLANFKIQRKVWKKKIEKLQKVKKSSVCNNSIDNRLAPRQINMNVNTDAIN